MNAANVVESEPTSPFVALFANMLVERRNSRFVTPRLKLQSCRRGRRGARGCGVGPKRQREPERRVRRASAVLKAGTREIKLRSLGAEVAGRRDPRLGHQAMQPPMLPPLPSPPVAPAAVDTSGYMVFLLITFISLCCSIRLCIYCTHSLDVKAVSQEPKQSKSSSLPGYFSGRMKRANVDQKAETIEPLHCDELEPSTAAGAMPGPPRRLSRSASRVLASCHEMERQAEASFKMERRAAEVPSHESQSFVHNGHSGPVIV